MAAEPTEAQAPISWDEALAALTGPGGPFEIAETEIDGLPYKAFATAPPTLRSLVDMLRLRGDQEYVVYEDERYTSAEVAAHVDALAAALVDHYGVRPGDRVGIAMRNYPEWIFAFYAITSIGAVAVAFNAWWTTEELDYGLRDSGASVVVADAERVERIAPLLGDLDVKILAVRAGDEIPAGVDRYEDVVDPGAAMPDTEPDPGADAMILYTSGTTGDPKGVVSTHRAVMQALWAFACRAISHAMSSTSGEKHPYETAYILVVPLFHVTGLVPVLLGSTLGGSKLVIMYRWDPKRALELIERERVTVFVGVPTMSWDLLESPDFATRDTSSLQNVGGGGAPAPPELVRRIDRNFSRGRPNIGYGMTETNAYGPQNSGDDYVRRPTSTGRAVPTCEMRIVDPATLEPVPAGEVGEVCFRGPHLFRGYWNKPEATAEVLSPDGWLRTGDLGYLDDEGYLFIVDRAKDLVIRAGENISCAEVEAVAYEHPGVYECAAFGVPHERLGEELVLAVHPRAEHDFDAEDLRAHIGHHLASFKVPSRVWVLDEPLPRNASGKILKRSLREGFLERT
jgi:long-chain acyl-CoA synthetase